MYVNRLQLSKSESATALLADFDATNLESPFFTNDLTAGCFATSMTKSLVSLSTNFVDRFVIAFSLPSPSPAAAIDKASLANGKSLEIVEGFLVVASSVCLSAKDNASLANGAMAETVSLLTSLSKLFLFLLYLL